MELYTTTAYRLSAKLTKDFSTSFSLSSRLFPRSMRGHIYAIYGMVRVADEIVDTYRGNDAKTMLDELEQHIEAGLAMPEPFSPNPIIHAFLVTARQYGISTELVQPFFASMRMDLSPHTYTEKRYQEYIYGSAEVVGLMCLCVFTGGNKTEYHQLSPGAQRLGAAYQKVNFLRDIKEDYEELGRVYFPGVTFTDFSNAQKVVIEADIEQDFLVAREAIAQLPSGAKTAVAMSYDYYYRLFERLKQSDVATIKTRRIRVSDSRKLFLLLKRLVLR